MRLIIQRVKKANIKINDELMANINNGLLAFVGLKKDDSEKDLDWFAEKIIKLRIFDDGEGKMNLSVRDINGEILLISQFTLYGNTSKGNRPSFIEAMEPQEAKEFYEKFIEKIKLKYGKIQSGVFGAMMKIELINDGPVTIIIEK